jgi:hypothetical protein
VEVPQTTGVAANRRTHVFHKPTFKCVAAMKDANKLAFDSTQAAEKAGYQKAEGC